MIQRRVLLTILLLTMAYTAMAQKEKHFNYGLKASFGSVRYDVEHLSIEGNLVSDYTTECNVSTTFSAFGRLNMQRHYLQLDAALNKHSSTVLFPTVEWMAGARSGDVSSITTQLTLVEMPFCYGYYLKNEGYYRLSFFTGPKVDLILPEWSSHSFTNFTQIDITETIFPIYYNWMGGFSISIKQFYFDLSAEMGLNNVSRGFTTQHLLGERHTGDFVYDRFRNSLNFSIGLIF